jgi:mono/diheme cytochrome c family protein
MIMRSLFGCSARTAAAVAFATAAHLAAAQSPAVPPLASGDADAGKTLHDKDCIACHAQRFGDPSKMYTRPDHRVKTPAQLRTQVAVCNTQLGTHYFPDDEDNVAAYLNREYYHFKP